MSDVPKGVSERRYEGAIGDAVCGDKVKAGTGEPAPDKASGNKRPYRRD